MTEPENVVQTLQDLGITRTEAEVYLATLQESHGGPVSAYRVAQSVGKDPANLSKTLASLEVLGAVRTIQEKPRLYVPIAPTEFTNQLIADMENNRRQVLKHLPDLETTQLYGIPMALNNQKQALAKATELMSRCRSELLLFADDHTLKMMGTNLEVLAVSSDVRVRLLSIEEFAMQGVEETVIGVPVGFADPQPIPWLQMIVDRQSWLTASFTSAGADKMPCGWWSDDPALALVFGASLSAAVDRAIEMAPRISRETSPADAPSAAIVEELSISEPTEEPSAGKNSGKNSGKIAPPPPQDDDGVDDDDGLKFIIRHEEND